MDRSKPEMMRRRIERNYLARQSLALHRMNLAAMLFLTFFLLSLMTALAVNTNVLFELAGGFRMLLGAVLGSTPAAQADSALNLAVADVLALILV